MTITRRDFLSASAALALTPALTSVFGARAWGAPLPREADIVVIGAGAAGIAAARRIQAARSERERGAGGVAARELFRALRALFATIPQ